MKSPKLTTIIITLNEAKQLPRCLESVSKLAGEIVVVDSGSTDETVEIAKKFGAKVYTRKFDNYANQKNFAVEKANGEWILALDADEELEPQLADEIKTKIADHNNEVVAYSIPRKNILFGKMIRYTRWQPELDRQVWLWKKTNGTWEGDVHETVVVDGEAGRLVNAKLHYQYDTVEEFVAMMNSYSELDAQQRVKKGVKFSLGKFLIDPLYNFIVRYIYRLGFLDGWRGFVLSYLMAIYQMNVWIKIREKAL